MVIRIKKIAKGKGIGSTELAKLLKRSRANIEQIFSRKSLDPDLLYEISKLLDYNFFELYAEKFRLENGAKGKENPIEILELQMKSQMKTNELQQKYIEMLEEKLEGKNENLKKKAK